MLLLCLNDDDVIEDGGLNPLIDGAWEDDDLKATTRSFCRAIVLISCIPYESTLPIACKMYMDTAKMAGYHLVFVEKDEVKKYKRLKIENAKSIFESDPENFLDEIGEHWYFCKCESNKNKIVKVFCYFM